MTRSSAVPLGHLVRALSQAETTAEVAQVIAEAGAVAAAAHFANIAMVNPDPERPGTAILYNASSLDQSVAQRYAVIPLDDTTPLGMVMGSGGEVWLGSLADVGARYPGLLADTVASGLEATASIALPGRDGRVVGAMGVGWGQPQAFSAADKDEIRVVARLAADALRRAQLLEAERLSRDRAEQLQQTMTALVASASLAEVTAAVVRLGLPFGASAAWLALPGQHHPGSVTMLEAIGRPGPVRAEWEAVARPLPSPSGAAVATSAPVYLPAREDLAARFPDASDLLARPGDQAWIALPLRRGTSTLGVLTLAFPRPHPLDDGRDQLILGALGAAVADALSRAIRHDADRDLVMSVQRSLLPKTLPVHPRVALGACYAPAERQYGIGGDWYDAMLLPSGQMLLIVGDVAGHGLDAAITMGQVRSAARALGPAHGPAALLDALDQFTAGIADMLSVTAAIVVIDPAERTLRYSLAGHPPLLLRAPDRSVTVLDEARGPILGFGVTGRPERTVRFLAGSCLVLFTDGLVERRHETIDAGFARLSAALAAATTGDPAGLCQALTDQSQPEAGRDDDTAVLSAFLA